MRHTAAPKVWISIISLHMIIEMSSIKLFFLLRTCPAHMLCANKIRKFSPLNTGSVQLFNWRTSPPIAKTHTLSYAVLSVVFSLILRTFDCITVAWYRFWCVASVALCCRRFERMRQECFDIINEENMGANYFGRNRIGSLENDRVCRNSTVLFVRVYVGSLIVA